MSKYMVIDETGLLPAFYAEDIHGPLELDIFGPKPEPSEDDPDPQPPKIGTKPNPAYPATDVIEISDDAWMDFLGNQGRRKWNPATKVFDPYDPPPPPVVPPPVSGDDVLDALSPEQAAKADVRDLIRLRGVPDVAMLKSKIRRIAKAAGTTPETIIGQVPAAR